MKTVTRRYSLPLRCILGTVASLLAASLVVYQGIRIYNRPSDEALESACATGDVLKVRLLLDAGANPNAITVNETTSFQWNLEDIYTYPVLMQAACRGDGEIVSLLLERGADIDAMVQHKTALIVAADREDLPMVQLLLQHGASVDEADKEAEHFESGAALVHAARNGYSRVCACLLEHGANVNGAVGGRTALTVAAEGGYDTTVRLLLEHGANAGPEDPDTPSDLAALNKHLSTIRLLRDRGAPTGFLAAVALRETKTVETLLKHGMQIDEQLLSGPTPLEAACQLANSDIIPLLVRYGADVNKHDFVQETPLLSIQTDDAAVAQRMVKTLKACGADLNAVDDGGDTALMQYALHGDATMVQALLHSGADPTRRNQEGKTALDCAIAHGDKKTIALLTHVGVKK